MKIDYEENKSLTKYYQEHKCQEFETFSKGKENFIVSYLDRTYEGKNGRIESELILRDKSTPCSFYRFAPEPLNNKYLDCNETLNLLNMEIWTGVRLEKNEWYGVGESFDTILYITKDGEMEPYERVEKFAYIIDNYIEKALYTNYLGDFIIFNFDNWTPQEIEKDTPFVSTNGVSFGIKEDGTLICSRNKVAFFDKFYAD